MKKVHVSIILLIGQFLWITPNLAQENQHQRPCDLPEGKQLDFWLGHWELSWPAEQFGGTPGTLQHGTNTVTKILDNCIIYESFRFPDGNFNGHSFSVYDVRDHQWKQTWVDNKGSYLLFTGEFKDGKMILSTAPYTRNGKTFISRMVFRNITSDSFDWDWQRSSDNGKTWQDMWNIHYQRSE